MKRREFIAFLGGGAAVAWPLAARAQQPATPVVGFLDSGSPSDMTANLGGLHSGLGEAGFTEGKNVTIEYRWAQGRYDQLPVLAAELVRRPVAVIAATRGSAPALAAKAATSTIPVVFQTGADPAKDGLVASFNRPGGNVTGASRVSIVLMPKRLGLLCDLVPKATVIACLVNPSNLGANSQIQELQEAARSRGLQLHVQKASTGPELDAAFAVMAQDGTSGLIIANDPFFMSQRAQLAVLAARHVIPAISSERESVAAGGLMSYDASLPDSFRQVGVYVGRILKGEKPADLPVVQPTKFDLVINLKTAKALGLTVPPTLLALADEVIE
jgi:putative ABC transport system substrate-binding protein